MSNHPMLDRHHLELKLQNHSISLDSFNLLYQTKSIQVRDPQPSRQSPRKQPKSKQRLPRKTAIMARGEAPQIKCHYKGTDEDFVVFVEDAKALNNWKTDKSIPLAQVVGSFKIFVTHKYV